MKILKTIVLIGTFVRFANCDDYFPFNEAYSYEPDGSRLINPYRATRVGESKVPAPPDWSHPVQNSYNTPGLPAAELAQQSTTKVPPFWRPELEKQGYPFRIWIQDVCLWISSTELQDHQKGPAIVARLGGAARVL